MNLISWRTWLTCAFIAFLMAFLPVRSALAQAANGAPFDLPVGSDYVLATLVIGFLMSPIISALNRRTWSAEVKAIAAFVWCALASLGLLVAGDQLNEIRLDVRSLFGTFLVVFVMAIGLYNFYFKPSGISTSIEQATG